MKFNFSASVGGWKPNINLSEKYQKTLGMFKTNIHPGEPAEQHQEARNTTEEATLFIWM